MASDTGATGNLAYLTWLRGRNRLLKKLAYAVAALYPTYPVSSLGAVKMKLRTLRRVSPLLWRGKWGSSRRSWLGRISRPRWAKEHWDPREESWALRRISRIFAKLGRLSICAPVKRLVRYRVWRTLPGRCLAFLRM